MKIKLKFYSAVEIGFDAAVEVVVVGVCAADTVEVGAAVGVCVGVEAWVLATLRLFGVTVLVFTLENWLSEPVGVFQFNEFHVQASIGLPATLPESNCEAAEFTQLLSDFSV